MLACVLWLIALFGYSVVSCSVIYVVSISIVLIALSNTVAALTDHHEYVIFYD